MRRFGLLSLLLWPLLLQAEHAEISKTYTCLGRVIANPDKYACVHAELAGTARAVYKRQGDSVQAGELLLTLDCKDMAELKSQYLLALARAESARVIWQREDRLFEDKVASQVDVQAALRSLDEAEIAVQALRQKLYSFGFTEDKMQAAAFRQDTDLRRLDIVSPIAGCIIKRDVAKGELLEPGRTLFELVDLSTVWVEVFLPPAQAAELQNGQRLGFNLLSDSDTHEGTFIYVDAARQEKTGLARVLGAAPNNDGHFALGSAVRVTYNIAAHAHFAVPNEAIGSDMGQNYVYVQEGADTKRCAVRVGFKGDTHSDIVYGLKPGDAVLTKGTYYEDAKEGLREVEHSH